VDNFIRTYFFKCYNQISKLKKVKFKNMKKKNIYFLIFILVALLVGGTAVYIIRKSQKKHLFQKLKNSLPDRNNCARP